MPALEQSQHILRIRLAGAVGNAQGEGVFRPTVGDAIGIALHAARCAILAAPQNDAVGVAKYLNQHPDLAQVIEAIADQGAEFAMQSVRAHVKKYPDSSAQGWWGPTTW